MRADIHLELTRRDFYALACEYWIRLVELVDERALAEWVAAQVPPLDERSDEGIARKLFYKLGEVENDK